MFHKFFVTTRGDVLFQSLMDTTTDIRILDIGARRAYGPQTWPSQSTKRCDGEHSVTRVAQSNEKSTYIRGRYEYDSASNLCRRAIKPLCYALTNSNGSPVSREPTLELDIETDKRSSDAIGI